MNPISIALILMMVTFALGALSSVLMVGKERKPITGGIAAGTVLLSAVYIVILFVAFQKLSNQ